jgi:hypothetical protein
MDKPQYTSGKFYTHCHVDPPTFLARKHKALKGKAPVRIPSVMADEDIIIAYLMHMRIEEIVLPRQQRMPTGCALIEVYCRAELIAVRRANHS